MKAIESYDGKRGDTNDLIISVNSILMSDQDFFEILFNQSKEHKKLSNIRT